MSGFAPALSAVSSTLRRSPACTRQGCRRFRSPSSRRLSRTGIHSDLAIVSDDAGQLPVLIQALKAYQAEPNAKARGEIKARLEQLCARKTCFVSLKGALSAKHRRGAELPRALDRPEMALHNNLSERDIGDPVKKRKLSGSTRGQSLKWRATVPGSSRRPNAARSAAPGFGVNERLHFSGVIV